MFDWVKRRRDKSTDEDRKQLTAPKLFGCSLCDGQFENKDLYQHWYTVHTIVVNDKPETLGHNSPLRSGPKHRSMVFIIRRPDFGNFTQSSSPFTDSKLAIADYFAQVIVMLKQERPGTSFQYIPMNQGELGLMTLLVVAEWDEE